MKPNRVPRWFQRFFPHRKWEGTKDNQQVYLTFDDGPVPGITDFVLGELAKRDQKATFFMVGDNMVKYPQIVNQVQKAGCKIEISHWYD